LSTVIVSLAGDWSTLEVLIVNWIQLLSAVLLVCFCQERHAWACAQGPTRISNSVPKNGETHPANYALIFKGDSIEPERLNVTVGEQSGQLVRAFDISPQAWRLEPLPKPGDEVNIDGLPCRETAFDCRAFSLTYTAGEVRNETPKPPVSAYFSVHEYPEVLDGRGDCEDRSDFSVYANIEKAEGEDLSLMRVTVFDSREPIVEGPGGFVGLKTRVNFSIGRILLTRPESPSEDDARHYCLRITTRTLAGQEASPVDFCTPCAYHVDEEPWKSSGEPNWDEAISLGGACSKEDAQGQSPDETVNASMETPAPANSEGGMEKAASDSGGCSTVPDAYPPWATVFVMLLLGIRRRI